MKLDKITKVGLGLLCLGLSLHFIYHHFVVSEKCVEVYDSIKMDTFFIEREIIDSLDKRSDTIFITLDNNDKYENEIKEAINDSDSIIVVRKFMLLLAKPIERQVDEDGDDGR